MMSYNVLEKQNHHLQLNIFQFEIKKNIMRTPASLVEFQALDIRTRVAWKASWDGSRDRKDQNISEDAIDLVWL